MKMKVGFVGCGGFSTGTHIPNVAKNPGLEIRAFCDLNTALIQKLKDEYHPVYVTTEMGKIFSDPEIDMVVCATKPDFRMPIMKLAVKHNKHLFVEKPLCYTNDDIEPMLKLIRSSSIKFMVGFNRPYSPMMQDIKPLYKKHKKGNTTIVYRIVGEARMWPKHHYDSIIHNKESTIIHEITHIFDLLNWLTDSFPQKVYTAGEGNTDNVITLSYPDNITAVIIAGDNSCAGYPKERIEINTDYNTIIGENFTEVSLYTDNGEEFHKIYDYSIARNKHHDEIRQVILNGCEWRKSVTPDELKYGYYYERMPKVDKGHYNEIDYFREVILEDSYPDTDVLKGAVASLTALKAIESWEKGVPLDTDFSFLEKL